MLLTENYMVELKGIKTMPDQIKSLKFTNFKDAKIANVITWSVLFDGLIKPLIELALKFKDYYRAK